MSMYSLHRFFVKILLNISRSKYIPSSKRYLLLKLAGVHIKGKCWIGEDVIFDSMYPENIEIEDGALIAMRSIILSHFYDHENDRFVKGKVHIGKRAYIFANSIICQPCTIGDFSLIAAGGVVTKDIPSRQILGGVPVRFIKVREI